MMRAAIGLSLLLVSGCQKTAEPVPHSALSANGAPTLPNPPPLDRAAQLRGAIPVGPQHDMLRSRCEICHSIDYVTQQRLSAAQWDKVLTKMQKWGAILTDEEKRQLVPFLAATWDSALPDSTFPLVRAPSP